MVALRGSNSSLNPLSHGCVSHGGQPQQGSIDVTQNLQTSMNMPQSAGVGQHVNPNQINLHQLNSVSLQFIPQPNNPNTLKHEQSRYSTTSRMLPSHHYRVIAQPRVECYAPGAAGAAYMGATAGGGQPSAQALRVQQTPQQPAQPQSQSEMAKTTMAGHSYVPTQNPAQQVRPQFSNFTYRTAQHGTRPNTHPRQQQPFITNAGPTATTPVMYPIVFQPHLGMPQYNQQPRSQGYYGYTMTPYLQSYTAPTSHTPPYYYANNQQLPAPNLQGQPTAGARSNPSPLVGPQGTPTAPAVQTATIPHPPAQTHMHQTIPGVRPPPVKRSHRVPIIDPVTQQEVLSDLYDSQYVSGESSERQTPQPEPSAHSVVEEFSRMVTEAANQPDSNVKSNYKNVEMSVPSTGSSTQPQSNAISSNNNNIVKSDILNVNENKTLGPDVVQESNETPVVSAISDSPVIVPKMPMSIKIQKPSDQNIQSLVVDTNKNVPANKQHKQKSKPVVPQVDEVVKAPEIPVPAAPVVVVVPVMAAPQPQRIREPRERVRSEEKEKPKELEEPEKDAPANPVKPNGPSSPVVISSVDSLPEVINPQTSQSSEVISAEALTVPTVTKQAVPIKVETAESHIETVDKLEKVASAPTQLLSSIEKVAKEVPESIPEVEAPSGIQAQVKLTQNLSSCLRTYQPDPKMKDINLNNKNIDSDTANGNPTEKTETVKEDINKNEKVVKNTNKNSNKKATSKMANNDSSAKDTESYENGKDETDKVSNVEELPNDEEAATKAASAEMPPAPAEFVPKYKYADDQWSPVNKAGKKCYDIGLLKQIKEDPMSKNKPNAPLLEACNVMRLVPLPQETSQPFNPFMPHVSLMPSFSKMSSQGSRTNTPRDPKKDGRGSMSSSGKGSMKLNMNPVPSQKSIFVSISLRGDDIKLNESENAWKPTRLKRESLAEEDARTEEVYKKFRGILNKLTPQKFDTLMEKVKQLEITTQKRLEGVIDLVFEKAIEEPNFSEAYAAMCNKLSMLKVPADNATSPDQFVNFRALIISRCQNQFVTVKVDENVQKLEKDIAECQDPTKKKELQLMLTEENRRIRMRSVGNVRFIGELYKLKVLTPKIMVFCMNYLISNLEEEKLECLCKLLTTIGQQVESEVKEQLDAVFKKMQDIVDKRQNHITSRVRFMMQDVIALRRRRWVAKSVVDTQPKTMDQIQKEAEQQQRHIEIMNMPVSGGGGGGGGNYRRDEGGRGKRGEGRRQGSNSFMDSNSNWKTPRANFTVDTSKLKAVGTPTQKNLSNIKLAPTNSGWNYGSSPKVTVQSANSSMISINKNIFSALENLPADPTILKGNATIASFSKGASIERSTFNARADFSSGGGSRSGSMNMGRSNSGSSNASPAVVSPAASVEAAPPTPVAQEPLPEDKRNIVKSIIDHCLHTPDHNELVAEIKEFPPQHHTGIINEYLCVALEKSANKIGLIAQQMLHLISTNTISADNIIPGITETFDAAPDLYIDIPMLYDFLGKILAPLIEKKFINFVQLLGISENIIAAKQGHLFLKAVIRELKDSMGPSFVKNKWQESKLSIKDWMIEDQVAKWIEDNKFEFLEGANTCEESMKMFSPVETQKKLLGLMNSDESCECIKGWVQDNLGKASNEDWFMRSLIQAICEHALFGTEGGDMPHFNQGRMGKYASLINEFGESREAREASCLFGIQQLIHRLEHPQGATLEIFQYLHEQYVITVEGFVAWGESEMEPEGKAVMMKTLTSFFTNIKEADNDEDSCSED